MTFKTNLQDLLLAKLIFKSSLYTSVMKIHDIYPYTAVALWRLFPLVILLQFRTWCSSLPYLALSCSFCLPFSWFCDIILVPKNDVNKNAITLNLWKTHLHCYCDRGTYQITNNYLKVNFSIFQVHIYQRLNANLS